jgi:hypothetical protein
VSASVLNLDIRDMPHDLRDMLRDLRDMLHIVA